MHTCIKCQENHSGKYCPNCGQLKLNELEWKHLFSQILEVLEMHRGLTYNLKELTLRPNRFVKDYLAGLTKGVMNPFSYILLILTSLTFSLGIIENLNDGLSGWDLLEVAVNWRVFIILVIMLFLAVAISCWIGGKRLLVAIIESSFFTAHYVLLVSLFVIFLNLIELKWAVPVNALSWGMTFFNDDKFTYVAFIWITLSVYAYAFFKPVFHLPRLNFRQILKSAGKSIVAVVLFFIGTAILDFTIWFSNNGSGMFSAANHEQIGKISRNWSKLNMRSEMQTELNHYLYQFDSSNQDIHEHITIVSQRLDSLENYIYKDTVEFAYFEDMSDWMVAKVNYSHVLDEHINPHLSVLKQNVTTFNDLLNKNDSSSLKLEIDVSELRTKSNAEVLYYFESKKQELLTIQSLFIHSSIDQE